eukprot:PhF_6_TR29353/c0_g1_i1/m.43155/K17915/KIF14; kinesin family member 14
MSTETPGSLHAIKAFVRIRPYRRSEIQSESMAGSDQLSGTVNLSATSRLSPAGRRMTEYEVLSMNSSLGSRPGSPGARRRESLSGSITESALEGHSGGGGSCTMVLDEGESSNIHCDFQITSTTVAVHNRHFEFDEVWWSVPATQLPTPTGFTVATQNLIYERLRSELEYSLQHGFNTCVFAYGQTGSGKTHTMMGELTDPQEHGLIPRLSSQILAGKDFTVKMMYVEIYNEKVFDLLIPLRSPTKKGASSTMENSLKVRTHPVDGPFIEGVRWVEVETVEDVLYHINNGNNLRATAETKMNERSSRSHAIVRFNITQTNSLESQGKRIVSYRRCNLDLVDLAGSERLKQSQASGSTLVEATAINQSLSTLRKIIDALVEEPSKRGIVPYRESTLTYILSSNLGGNCCTYMISTISPSSLYIGESLNTLAYASRARSIKAMVHANEDETGRLIAQLREEMQKMVTAQANAVNEKEAGDLAEQIALMSTSITDLEEREKSALDQLEEEHLRLVETQQKLQKQKEKSATVRLQVGVMLVYISVLKQRHKTYVEELEKANQEIVDQLGLALQESRQKCDALADDLKNVQQLYKLSKDKDNTMEKELAGLHVAMKEMNASQTAVIQENASMKETLSKAQATAAEFKAKSDILEHQLKFEHDTAIRALEERLQKALQAKEQAQKDIFVAQYKHAEELSWERDKRTEALDAYHNLQREYKELKESDSSLESKTVELTTKFLEDLNNAYSSLKDVCAVSGSALGVHAPINYESRQEVQEFVSAIRKATQYQLMEDKAFLYGDKSSVEDCDLAIFVSELRALPGETQTRLFRRFRNIIEGHKSKNRTHFRFGEFSGLPDRSEEPTVLINMIANLTHENEMLVEQIVNLGKDPTAGTLNAPRIGHRGRSPVRRARRGIMQMNSHVMIALKEGYLCSIGRNPTNDMVLEDHRPSRTHAVVKCPAFPDPCIIFDLGSETGTFVNGKPVGPQGTQLISGDSLSFWEDADANNTFKYVENTESERRNSPHRGGSPSTEEILLPLADQDTSAWTKPFGYESPSRKRSPRGTSATEGLARSSRHSSQIQRSGMNSVSQVTPVRGTTPVPPSPMARIPSSVASATTPRPQPTVIRRPQTAATATPRTITTTTAPATTVPPSNVASKLLPKPSSKRSFR